jgi:hypothetical protein
MKKLENILAENMRRFGTKNLYEVDLNDLENKLGFDSGANRDPRTGNPMFDPNNLKLHINRVDYDTNISGITSMYFQGSGIDDKNTFQDIVNDIKQDIESKNDPTGAYDQTRLVSDITFDCELKVGTDTIDLTVTYDEDGDIQNVEIQDEDIATKYGISDSTIMDYLF